MKRKHRILAGITACVVGLTIAGCGGDDETSATVNPDFPSVALANKGFTESDTITEAYAQALRAKGFPVTIKPLQSSAIADAAIMKGDIDMYPDYTGTILSDILKAKNPPADVEDQVSEIGDRYAERGLAVLDVAPFNNDNEVACTKDAVDKYSLTNLSSLGPASPNLVYSANPEHTTRADGLPLLQNEYGINFKRVAKVAITLRYRPIEQNEADCVYAFGTDPQIAKNDLVVLDDDKGKFGGIPYQGIPVVSKAFLDAAPPEFAETINAVSAKLTSDEVRAMTSAVDLDKEDPDVVAKDFLERADLL